MGVEAFLQKRFAGWEDGPHHEEPFELNIHLMAETGVTVLLGPSGSGKTLTMNCLGGFVKPDTGRILLNGNILFDSGAGVNLPPERRRCGYIFQDHALFPHMTVRENLLFAAHAAPKERRGGLVRRRQIKELLESFELTDLAERKAAQLSGGQKQRAALARILVSAPRLLMLDEPTRGLDARLREAFYYLLKQTGERLQIPVLLITHDVEECLRLADFICLVERGRFLQSGTRQSVVDAPASVEAAKALGIFNLLPAEILALDPVGRASWLRVLDSEIPGPHLRGHLLHDRGTICFRESEMQISAVDEPASTPGIVVKVVSAHPSSRGVRLQFGEQFYCTVPQVRWGELRKSERMRVWIPPAAVYFIG